MSANRILGRAGIALWIGFAAAAIITGIPALFWGCLSGIALLLAAEFG